MAPWTKMPLNRKVGLDPNDIVLDGDPAAPFPKGSKPPIFGTCLLWPNGCMEQDVIRYRARPRLRPHCAGWEPSSRSRKGVTGPIVCPCILRPKG